MGWDGRRPGCNPLGVGLCGGATSQGSGLATATLGWRLERRWRSCVGLRVVEQIRDALPPGQQVLHQGGFEGAEFGKVVGASAQRMF